MVGLPLKTGEPSRCPGSPPISRSLVKLQQRQTPAAPSGARSISACESTSRVGTLIAGSAPLQWRSCGVEPQEKMRNSRRSLLRRSCALQAKDHDSNKTECALPEKRAIVLAVPSRANAKSRRRNLPNLPNLPNLEARHPSYRYERIPGRESLLARNIVSGCRAVVWHLAVSPKGCSPHTDWRIACGNCGNCFSPSSMPGSRRRRTAPAAICSRAAWR
jgi:hypothetical protein